MNPNSRMRGFSVLELLIALSIGLLVSLAAVQLFVTNQVNFMLQRGLGDVSENGRFALDFMARQIRQGNYVPPGNTTVAITNTTTVGTENVWSTVVVGTDDLPTGTCGLGTVISANDNAALAAPSSGKQGGVGASDSLLIQYYTPIATMDCEGTAVPAASFVLARFFLRADTVAGTGSALACEGGYHTGVADAPLVNFSTTNTGGVVVLSSVDNFQVLLGVANTAAGLNNVPQQYMTISDYAALAKKRPPVSAIKLGMLVSSVDKAGNLLGTSPSFTVLDKTLSSTDIPTDNRVRRMYANTVTLRNLL